MPVCSFESPDLSQVLAVTAHNWMCTSSLSLFLLDTVEAAKEKWNAMKTTRDAMPDTGKWSSQKLNHSPKAPVEVSIMPADTLPLSYPGHRQSYC